MAPRGRGLDLAMSSTPIPCRTRWRERNRPRHGRRKMSKYDRQFETVDGSGQKIIMHEGPAEIASWFFPNETPEDDKRRIALTKAIEDLLDKRITEAIRFLSENTDAHIQSNPSGPV